MIDLTPITDHSFDPEVLKCDIPVLTCFQAEWFPAASKLKPVLAAIASAYAGRLKIGVLDINTSPTVTAAYSVLKMPTLILFKHGQVVARLTGDFSEQAILEQVIPFLDV